MEENDLTLRLHRIDIDTVEAYSRPLLVGDFYGKKILATPPIMIERLWREICGKECFNQNDTYPNGRTAFFAFMQMLSDGCVQAARHRRRSYHEILDDEWRRKAASYIVETLRPSDDVSEGVKNARVG